MFKNYQLSENTFDEVFDQSGEIREYYKGIANHFSIYDKEGFEKLNDEAKLIFFNEGITFSVYTERNTSTEQIFPFDLVPRLIPKSEWNIINRGVLQRNRAINDFLTDIYGQQAIIKDKVVPRDLIESSSNYLPYMKGLKPNGGIYNHISGSDIIRHSDGKYYILEDNVRCPSGVSYVVANRKTLKKTFPTLFADYKPLRVDNYSSILFDMLQSVKPLEVEKPNCVVLTPGIYNSAYYEHSWLAQSMGIQLVEGRDLFVENNYVFEKTIYGAKRVDVIYRRIDDPYIDPDVFRKDSMLGVKGLMEAYKSGNVTLVNAPGTGVADDKAIYTYMPKIIKYYRNEDPILENIPTYHCANDEDFKYVKENINKLVIKPVDESGGYGISIGNTLSKDQIEEVRNLISENRRKYIAQPIMTLSTHPTYIAETEQLESRFLDLRTFCLLGKDFEYVVPGGLTRVALKRGNLIVNSSQGGGSKDTWIIE